MPASSPRTLPTLNARADALADPAHQRALLGAVPLTREFETCLADSDQGLWPLRAQGLEILQLNLGRMCNQTCRHCHVDAGPDREEVMERETLEACLDFARRANIPTLDLTGGAPEMNPHFRWFVDAATRAGLQVLDRCNLTIVETGPGKDLPEFFATHGVEVICSLPHYRELGTDRQRGRGVYDRSISALHKLNALGYGDGQSGLKLRIVTNPVGAFLSPAQASLEDEWKHELKRLHGIVFDSLYTITNMPISRYLEWLHQSGNLDTYLQKLAESFNPAAAQGVMCRTLLSVGWDGRLFDCDFNQMLNLGLGPQLPSSIQQLAQLGEDAPGKLGQRVIQLGRHCFGCTAGAGSSCGGSTA